MSIQRPGGWLLAAVLLLGTATTSAQRQFRSRVDVVQLPVVVTTPDGDVVHGLTADDFEVLEDGKRHPISMFSEGETGRDLPLRLGLLLDTSESMERDLRSAANAAVRFVDLLVEATDVTFVDFSTRVNVGRFEPPSYPQLFERIRSGKAGGGTSLYDALGVYVQRSLDRTGQHIVLLHTDGGDSTSSMTFGRLQSLLRLGNVIVYVVGYMQNQMSLDRMPQQMRIAQIAHETGGEAFFPSSREDIDRAYERIRAEIASRYTLGYQPSNPPDDGTYRKIEVRLVRDDLRDARIRTRAGYLAPGDSGRRK
jgi:Ca-activated chloride channel family protein